MIVKKTDENVILQDDDDGDGDDGGSEQWKPEIPFGNVSAKSICRSPFFAYFPVCLSRRSRRSPREGQSGLSYSESRGAIQ